jgi:hypothetical protein
MDYLPQRLGCIIDEGFLVGDDIGMSNRGEYSDFIESVFFLFIRELEHADLLQSIVFTVSYTSHMVNATIGSLP